MPHSNIIAGNTEDEVWKTIAEQLTSKKDNLDYTAQFNTGTHNITLDIDINPNGGDENGKALTSFSTPLPEDIKFRFSIERQGFKQQIGKLFGLQDVIVGNAEFDKKFLIKGNDEAKVKEVLSDANVSSALLRQPVVEFEVRENKIGAYQEIVLALDVEGGISNPTELQSVYQAFKIVLNYLDNQGK